MLSAALAVALTAGAWFVDRERQRSVDTAASLRWARQIASQAEALILPARIDRRKDPLAWAASLLNQGSEPRAAHVTKTRVPSGRPAESFTLDQAKAEFDYTRVILAPEGAAIRVRIPIGLTGFLGSRSLFTQDLLLLMMAAASFLALQLLWGILRNGSERKRREAEAAAPGPSPADAALGASLQAVSSEIRLMLTRLSVNIREMIREAQNLAVAAGKSRDSVSSLRDDIHAEINHMREGREAIHELEQIAVLAETAALNLVIEAGKMGLDGKQASVLSEELHRLVQKIRKLNRDADTRVANLEKKLEPWSTDADLAFHAYDDVFRATREMDTHIRRTTETLLGQAKLIQSIRNAPAAIAPPEPLPALGAKK